ETLVNAGIDGESGGGLALDCQPSPKAGTSPSTPNGLRCRKNQYYSAPHRAKAPTRRDSKARGAAEPSVRLSNIVEELASVPTTSASDRNSGEFRYGWRECGTSNCDRRRTFPSLAGRLISFRRSATPSRGRNVHERAGEQTPD